MKVSRSGFVLEFPHILEELKETASGCRNAAHRVFVDAAIMAFEEVGPDAEPLLNGCPQDVAQMIFDEVTEAYTSVSSGEPVGGENTFRARAFQLPYSSHRREQGRRAERERRVREATGLNRLRELLTLPG
ncbi:hypothetical protein OG458_42255 (plasmid) [Streptomyces sp. NBC_01281]|uniref:hypothetical protein n=1 Tax=Streptomyces sp. NBC_01281 TaxID=2903811 RepID=UPI002E14BA16|nr:hypothetical protein OG458_42255 [Streptomyces sp. NBC_01281]